MVKGHMEYFSFVGVAEREMFGSCRAAQTVVTDRYKSLYHKAGLPFYRKIMLVVLLS